MHDFYLNKFFRRIFFGNGGQATILLMTLLFLLNLAVVTVVDGYLIHNIPPVEDEISAAYFPDQLGPNFAKWVDGQFLDVYGNRDGYHVLCLEDSGELTLTEVKYNDITKRYRLDRNTRIVIPRDVDPYTYDNGDRLSPFRFTITGGEEITELEHWEYQWFSFSGSETLSAYMLIALGLMLAQVFIAKKILGKE